MKKVIIVLRNLEGGGAERVVLNFIRYLKRNSGCEITLFLLKNSGVYFSELENNINVIYGSKYRLFLSFPIILFRLFNASIGKEYLIAGTEGEPAYFINIVAFLQRKIPINWVHVVLSKYLKIVNPIHYLLTKFFYFFNSKIVCVSQGVKQDHLEIFPQKKDLFVINNILDAHMIMEKSKEINLNIQNDSKDYFCAVGRLSYEKGFDRLIKAISILKPMYPNLVVKIFGDGPLYGELKDLIHVLNLQENIFLMGFQSKIYIEIKNSKGLIHSSRFEGLGMVLLEAMSLSIPVVATDCPYGPSEIIGNNKFGILAENSDDSRFLAKKIEFLILISPDERKLLIEKAFERVNDFSPEKIMREWEKALCLEGEIR